MYKSVLKTICAWVLLGGTLSLGPGVASAQFSFVSQTATYIAETNTISFFIEFNQTPDFVTTDSAGRIADSFQYYVRNDLDLPYPAYYDSIVRVEPSFISAGLLVARSPLPSTSDPSTGGWGLIRGVSSFQLDGRALTFEMPVSVLSDHGPLFKYEFMTAEYGGMTGLAAATVVGSIPEPNSVVLLALGLALFVVLYRLQGAKRLRLD